jgi:hypothetical protein
LSVVISEGGASCGKGPIFSSWELDFDMQSVAQNACKVLAFFTEEEKIMHIS